jgi:phage tail-like protein
MAVLRAQPYEGSFFVVDLGAGIAPGDPQARFLRVELPEARVDDVTYRSGEDPTMAARHEPGLTTYGRLVLKRGLIGSLDLWEWWKQARSGDRNVDRDIAVQLLDEDRAVVWRWRFLRAFPVAYRVTPLDATTSDIVAEIIELTFDAMEID